jgi:hypothetical protein
MARPSRIRLAVSVAKIIISGARCITTGQNLRSLSGFFVGQALSLRRPLRPPLFWLRLRRSVVHVASVANVVANVANLQADCQSAFSFAA